MHAINASTQSYIPMFKLKRSYIEKVDQIPWRDIVFLLEIALQSELSALALVKIAHLFFSHFSKNKRFFPGKTLSLSLPACC